jgi:hypothetical protein
MTNCIHKICGKEDRKWLPVTEANNYSIEKHSWCLNCGVIKNMSDDRPHGIGYWMNLLSSISNYYKLKQCQKRLIAKEIELSENLNDKFGTYGSNQRIIFKRIIKKYINKNIDAFVY